MGVGMGAGGEGPVRGMQDRTFAEFVVAATGGEHGPYEYQQRLADEGLPDLLRVPTGTGKTLAATLPWLYRRRHHPEDDVRASTPRRLVIVLPQRSLVEQTFEAVQNWLGRVDPEVRIHRLLGGASTDDREWKVRPHRDGVLVGTQDMVLSRLLMRGYGEYRAAWPMSYGLLHADTQFVFDEVQLMGPALPTSMQLEGLRRALGTVAPSRSMWMSATVDARQLRTVDFPGVQTVVELSDEDRAGHLRARLDGTRTIRRLRVDEKRYAAELAAVIHREHHAGTRTIAVLNTVDRAIALFQALQRLDAPVTLVHSRFRPPDRRDRYSEAVADPGPEGRIVVSTQVLEAGVDITSRLLVTEAAPWPSIVQRAGRCNRAGGDQDATVLWTEPPSGRSVAAPYEDTDLARTVEALTALEGQAVTSTALQEHDVSTVPVLHPVLRRRDLLDLFDTAPDLSGNDIDVSRWIRDGDDVTAAVAWRAVGKAEEVQADGARLTRDELCPAPLGDVREIVANSGRGWIFDQTTSAWRHARRGDVRPGAQLLLDASGGGYLPERGWAPGSRTAVQPVPAPDADEESLRLDGLGDDPLAAAGRWVSLRQHLQDVGDEIAALLNQLGELSGVTAAQREALRLAGMYHDLGKAHEVFVTSLARFPGAPLEDEVWAKSGSKGRLCHHRPAFRHELASALMVLHPDSGLLDEVGAPDLLVYLVAAHHGKVRTAVRAVESDGDDHLLGVGERDVVGPVTLPDGRTVPELTLDRAVLSLGIGRSGDSWQARTARLREELGPFRLAFLEAIVRAADWRASARYDRPAPAGEVAA